MLTFTDLRKYVMGIGVAYATSLRDGSVVFWSDKYQEGNTTFGANEMVLSGGIGNGPAIILYNDPNISVAFTAADYMEYVRAAATGAKFGYGAPVETCQIVTASGAALTLDASGGAPVAGPGAQEVRCFVQEVGAASPIATGGAAYALDAETGAISGFVAESGKRYLVTYWTVQANASMTTYTSDFNGDVVRFVYRRPIYTNFKPETNSGDLYGWLIDIIPYLKLNPSTASTNGSQSAFSTTGINGRALVFEDAVVSDSCDDCTLAGAPLMYSILVPCDETEGVEGVVGVLGGSLALAVGDTAQLAPAVVVNGRLTRDVPPGDFTYASGSDAVATVSGGGVVTGVGAGSTQVTVTYAVGEESYQDTVNVSVSGD